MRKGGISIGVVACSIMRRELEPLLAGTPEVTHTVWCESALHNRPAHMRQVVAEKISEICGSVDIVFLGFGRCRSLEDIAAQFDVPIHHPAYDDCLAILMTPQRYREELRKEAGTWFMTPGWAEINSDMVIKELGIDRMRQSKMSRMDLARRFFATYRRGLYVETGIGTAADEQRARNFCEEFGLGFERIEIATSLLKEELEQCRDAASTRKEQERP